MSRNTSEFMRKARYSQKETSAVRVCGLMPFLRAVVADHEAGTCGGDDARPVQVIRHEVAAVGDDGGQRDFDFRIVDRPRNATGNVTKDRSDYATANHRENVMRDSLPYRRAAGLDGREQNLEQHKSGAVVQ